MADTFCVLVEQILRDLGARERLAATFTSLHPKIPPMVTCARPAGQPLVCVVYLDVTLRAVKDDVKAYESGDPDHPYARTVEAKFAIDQSESGDSPAAFVDLVKSRFEAALAGEFRPVGLYEVYEDG